MCDEMFPSETGDLNLSKLQNHVFSPTAKARVHTLSELSTMIFITQMGQLYGGAQVQFS